MHRLYVIYGFIFKIISHLLEIKNIKEVIVQKILFQLISIHLHNIQKICNYFDFIINI